jgi:hypothetical protein
MSAKLTSGQMVPSITVNDILGKEVRFPDSHGELRRSPQQGAFGGIGDSQWMPRD